MKKALILLTVAALLLTAGCTNSKQNDPTTPSSGASEHISAKSAEEIYTEISSTVQLPEMIKLDAKKIENKYGIEPSMYEECLFATAMEATLADTVVLIKASSESNVSSIVDKLNTFIDQVKNENQSYLPEQFEIVNKSSVKIEGLYVYLVFSENMDTIETIIKNAIK